MARAPLAALGSLDDALALAYAIHSKLRDDEDMPALVARIKAKGFGAAALKAKRDALVEVEARCIVSRVQRAVLDDVAG